MKSYFIELPVRQSDSQTKCLLSDGMHVETLWTSTYNPTLGSDIITEPLTDGQKPVLLNIV